MNEKNNDSASLNIIGLSHILLQVQDLEKAKEFYCDFLGLKIKKQGTFLDNRQLIVTEQGIGLTTVLYETIPGASEERYWKCHNLEHAALWISGMDNLVKRLKNANIVYQGPVSNEYGLSIRFCDPDGNKIECIEEL